MEDLTCYKHKSKHAILNTSLYNMADLPFRDARFVALPLVLAALEAQDSWDYTERSYYYDMALRQDAEAGQPTGTSGRKTKSEDKSEDKET